MGRQNTLMVFAIIAALGLLNVAAVDIMLMQGAEAKGCPNSIAANASKGRCVNPGG
jgi:hypothetical protein